MVEQRGEPLDAVFHALADETRRQILRRISRRPERVTDVAEPFNMSLAAVSKHLDVLERADLIRRERKGTCRMVRLQPDRLRAAQQWLTYYETFWKQSLDRLQEQLETQHSPKHPTAQSKEK